MGQNKDKDTLLIIDGSSLLTTMFFGNLPREILFAKTDEEKEKSKKDLTEMLDYVGKLNELDTSDVEPMSHTFPISNVLREDVVSNGDDRENMLKNAPQRNDDAYIVPETF